MGPRVLQTFVVPAISVVRGPTQEPREWQDEIVISRWHFLVAANAFLRQQVRPCATHSRGAILVMDVHQELVFGCLPHGFVQPGRPLLRTYIHKSVFDTFYTPCPIKRENLIQLLLQRAPV